MKTKKTQKGCGFLNSLGNSLVQFPKRKNYNVHMPGQKYINLINPSKTEKFFKAESEKVIKIIFNYRLSNQIDITQSVPNTIISSESITNEPYTLVNSMGKYLLVMYREVNKKNVSTPKLLLHWLVGYMNMSRVKLFSFIAPKIKSGRIQKFIIKLYKYPDSNNKEFIKINNINKKKAYDEFNTHITNNKLLTINTFIFNVKGSSNQGIDLFNIFTKKHLSKEDVKLMSR